MPSLRCFLSSFAFLSSFTIFVSFLFPKLSKLLARPLAGPLSKPCVVSNLSALCSARITSRTLGLFSERLDPNPSPTRWVAAEDALCYGRMSTLWVGLSSAAKTATCSGTKWTAHQFKSFYFPAISTQTLESERPDRTWFDSLFGSPCMLTHTQIQPPIWMTWNVQKCWELRCCPGELMKRGQERVMPAWHLLLQSFNVPLPNTFAATSAPWGTARLYVCMYRTQHESWIAHKQLAELVDLCPANFTTRN